MAVEAKRGCGFRKVGGLYLVGSGPGISCHRLPLNIHVCPVCSSGIKYSRGFTWFDANKFFGKCELPGVPMSRNPKDCHRIKCAVCFPPKGKQGLMWIGKKFYTPNEFTKESQLLGVSKRIATIPRNFVLGETWIYLAHLEAGTLHLTAEEKAELSKTEMFAETKKVPGVFYCFKPQRIEKIITKSQSKDKKEMEKLEKQGITPVVVSDLDKDHLGSVHDEE